MKILLVNSSAHLQGCTYTALMEVARTLEECGAEWELLQLGGEPLRDCIGCGGCAKKGEGQCVFDDDVVNDLIRKAREADGFVFGTPVYYAHPSGRLMSFMDRVFYSAGAAFRFKPAACVFSARRAGSVCSMDVVNKHFSICSMPIVSSNYWNHVFGNSPKEVEEDAEGLMTMKNIGKNMAWLLKCIEAGKAAGIAAPDNEKITTNFVR